MIKSALIPLYVLTGNVIRSFPTSLTAIIVNPSLSQSSVTRSTFRVYRKLLCLSSLPSDGDTGTPQSSVCIQHKNQTLLALFVYLLQLCTISSLSYAHCVNQKALYNVQVSASEVAIAHASHPAESSQPTFIQSP